MYFSFFNFFTLVYSSCVCHSTWVMGVSSFLLDVTFWDQTQVVMLYLFSYLASPQTWADM